MTISKDLFLSILAMDAYNCGYDAGIDGLGGEGKRVGTATTQRDAEQLLDQGTAEAASFYALSYDIGSDGPEGLADKRVISYRGTDNIPTTELLNVDAPIILGSTITRQLEAEAVLSQNLAWP